MTSESAPRLSTGDLYDDDVAALDQQVEHSNNGPSMSTMPTEPYDVPVARPASVTRMTTLSQVMDAQWTSGWQSAPRDEGREKLILTVRPYSSGGTVRMAGTREDLAHASTCATLGAGTYDLGAHTGAIWLSGPDLTDQALVSLITITS